MPEWYHIIETQYLKFVFWFPFVDYFRLAITFKNNHLFLLFLSLYCPTVSIEIETKGLIKKKKTLLFLAFSVCIMVKKGVRSSF